MPDLTKEMRDTLELAKKIMDAHGYAFCKRDPNPEPWSEPWPKPRPYTLGDEIKLESHPTMRAFALMEHTDDRGSTEIFTMTHHNTYKFNTCWTASYFRKPKCTHLDGTPLGEFRAVPTWESGIAFPTSFSLKKGWTGRDRNTANTAILAFRDKLGEADDA